MILTTHYETVGQIVGFSFYEQGKLKLRSSDLPNHKTGPRTQWSFYNTCCLLEAHLKINREWVWKKYNWIYPKPKWNQTKSTAHVWQNGKSRPALVIETIFLKKIYKRQSHWKLIFYKMYLSMKMSHLVFDWFSSDKNRSTSQHHTPIKQHSSIPWLKAEWYVTPEP